MKWVKEEIEVMSTHDSRFGKQDNICYITVIICGKSTAVTQSFDFVIGNKSGTSVLGSLK
jgi:hypothetical protein